MTNNEIIEEELEFNFGIPLREYVKHCYSVTGKLNKQQEESVTGLIHKVATSLLAKLNIPEEGEVIAEGEVKYNMVTFQIFIGNKELDDIREDLSEMLEDYKGKKGRLIFIPEE